MPETSPTQKVEIYNAPEIPEENWRDLQLTQYESAKSYLPKEEWERAATITRLDDPARYIQSRVDPNSQAGRDGWYNQRFKNPRLAVLFDGSQMVGAVFTQENASPTRQTPNPLKPLDSWLKMNLPTLGFRHGHLREAYLHPDIKEKSLAISGLYHLLEGYLKDHELASYYTFDDPADSFMVQFGQELGLKKDEGYKKKMSEPGYLPDAIKSRMARDLGNARDHMKSLPDVRALSKTLAVHRYYS